jgi:hypothetical protein
LLPDGPLLKDRKATNRAKAAAPNNMAGCRRVNRQEEVIDGLVTQVVRKPFKPLGTSAPRIGDLRRVVMDVFGSAFERLDVSDQIGTACDLIIHKAFGLFVGRCDHCFNAG